MTIDEIKAPFASGGDRQNISYNPAQNGIISWLAGYTYLYELKPTETPISPYIERTKFNEIMYLMSAKMLDIEKKSSEGLESVLDEKLDKDSFNKEKRNFVTLDTKQTISGVKTFTKAPNGTATPKANNDYIRLIDLKTIGAGIGTGGQRWVDVTDSRRLNVIYTNTTGKAIMVVNSQYWSLGERGSSGLYCDDVLVAWYEIGDDAGGLGCASIIVPPGSTYYKKGNQSGSWAELR